MPQSYFLGVPKMTCPYCSAKTSVTNSRSHNADQAVWRRRQCKSCKAVWTTDETYDLSKTHQVKTPSQKQPQPFRRDILFMSIWKALQHRNDALVEATGLTDTIITQVLALKQPIIQSSAIKKAAQAALTNFDKTAAAVYTAQS